MFHETGGQTLAQQGGAAQFCLSVCSPCCGCKFCVCLFVCLSFFLSLSLYIYIYTSIYLYSCSFLSIYLIIYLVHLINPILLLIYLRSSPYMVRTTIFQNGPRLPENKPASGTRSTLYTCPTGVLAILLCNPSYVVQVCFFYPSFSVILFV